MAPKQKGGCLDTLAPPWIRHCTNLLSKQGSHRPQTPPPVLTNVRRILVRGVSASLPPETKKI